MHRKSNLTTLLVITIFFLLVTPRAYPSANPDIQNSIVKIYTTQSNPDYDNPWNTLRPEIANGTGSIIRDNFILTNAHVVSNQTFIQVQSHGRPKRFPAKVVAVSHSVDLALLSVEDSTFYENVEALELGEMPQMQQEVIVYGYPIGGDTLSTTKGVISRIEHQTYAHSDHKFLAAQIDAAINPGNSGGPAVSENRIVGVVMQMLSNGQNIGYIVPTPIIKHFLQDLEDGHYDGFPSSGIIVQNMENPGLRKKYGLAADQTGILVTNILSDSPAEGKILSGDVILSIDSHDVADDATVALNPIGRIDLNHLIQMHQIGDKMKMGIFRNGKVKEIEFVLTKTGRHYDLVHKEQFDIEPAYFIYGGLVFMPLTVNYLKTWGENWDEQAPSYLLSKMYDLPETESEEVVIMSNVLPANVSVGYHEYADLIITAVNGKDIHSLNDLIKEVEKGKGQPFITFTDKHGSMIVLDRNQAEKELEGILEAYKIPADRELPSN